MSWDVLLLKEKFDENVDQDYKPPVLGDKKDLIQQLTEIFPNLDFTDKSWGILETNDFSIEFNIGKNEIVDTLMLHIRGGGEPTKVIKQIMYNLKWEAYDCSTGDFIDLNNISNDSWVKFQNWRDKIFKRNK